MATQDSSLELPLGPVPPPAHTAIPTPPLVGGKSPVEDKPDEFVVYDLASDAPLPDLPDNRLPTLEEFQSRESAEAAAPRSRPGLWFSGDALMCACPDCLAPMTVRTFLMVADCWNCGTSIELNEEMEREARKMLAERDARQPAEGPSSPAPAQPAHSQAKQPSADQGKEQSKSRAAAATAPSPPADRSTPGKQPTRSEPSKSELSKSEPSNGEPPQSEPPKTEPARSGQSTPASRPADKTSPQNRRRPGQPARSPARQRTPAAVADTRRRIRRLTAASMVQAWLSEMVGMTPAWLISAVLHFVVLLILALIPMPDEDGRKIVLSTSLSVDREGGEVVHLNPQDDAEFDLPVPEDFDLKDPEVKQALLKANQEARELRLDPDAVEPLLPQLSDVKNQIGSSSARKSLAARDPRVRVEMVEKEGGTSLTEAAVARSLRYLASQQNDDGGWSLRGGGSDEAGTSLALLPFLGAGQTHLNGVYKDTVAGGLRWLVEHQRENGDLRYRFQGANQGMYAHGQGTIVLCEAFAMEGDEKLRVPAQKAIDFIVTAQHRGGGWRYQPGQAGDTSVLGWQLMALQSARVAGLTTPDSTFALADQFLDSVQARNFRRRDIPGYAYQRGRNPSRAMTAEALLCRMYNGWTEENPDLQQDVAWLAENHMPRENDPEMYYWYYGTQVFHHVGGVRWEQWNRRMRDILVLTQDRRGDDAGSWPPRGGHDNAGGRIYTTSLAACTLEVYYRHLPIFRQIKLD